VTRRDLLAIVESLKSFYYYLYGRKFLIRTNHISLRCLMSFRDLEGQLALGLERVQQCEFEIIHQKGQLHQNVDGLSRHPCTKKGCTYCAKAELKENSVARIVLEEENLEEWRKRQLEDPVFSVFLRGKELGRRPLHEEIAM